MSAEEECGESSCAEVLADLYVYLDNECDASAKARITAHLDDCGPCLRHYGIETEVKSMVARCCGGDVAPGTLRDKVLARLRDAGVTP